MCLFRTWQGWARDKIGWVDIPQILHDKENVGVLMSHLKIKVSQSLLAASFGNGDRSLPLLYPSPSITPVTSCPDLCQSIQHQPWTETKPRRLRKDMMCCELQEICSSPGPSLSRVSVTWLATCKVTEVLVISWMESSQQTQTEDTIHLQRKGCSVSSERG